MKTVALLVLAVALAPAETREERGRRVVNEALAALGGDRYLEMQDRIEEGRVYSFYNEELTGLARAKIYTRYLAPGKPGTLAVRERQAFGKNEDYGVLFLEDGQGWSLTFRGAKPLPAETLDRFRESTLRNVFYIFRERLKEPGLTFDGQGADVWMNQPVEMVEINDAENRNVLVYFHKSTKLPVRQVFYRRDPKTKERQEEVTLFSKFRDVGGGVQWPFTVQRSRNGEKIFEIYADSVQINQDLTDERFTLPSTIKILKQKP